MQVDNCICFLDQLKLIKIVDSMSHAPSVMSLLHLKESINQEILVFLNFPPFYFRKIFINVRKKQEYNWPTDWSGGVLECKYQLLTPIPFATFASLLHQLLETSSNVSAMNNASTPPIVWKNGLLSLLPGVDILLNHSATNVQLAVRSLSPASFSLTTASNSTPHTRYAEHFFKCYHMALVHMLLDNQLVFYTASSPTPLLSTIVALPQQESLLALTQHCYSQYDRQHPQQTLVKCQVCQTSYDESMSCLRNVMGLHHIRRQLQQQQGFDCYYIANDNSGPSLDRLNLFNKENFE